MNRKTNKRIRSLKGNQLNTVISSLNLKGYSKLLVSPKQEKIIKEVDDDLLLEILYELGFVEENEVEWKRWFFRKTIQWKGQAKITKANNKIQANNTNLHPLITLVLFLFLSSFLFYTKPYVTLPAFDLYVCESIGKKNKAKIVELAIDLNNQVYQHSDIENELKQLLVDEVFWFKKPKKSKEKINFGTRVYDEFCFCEKPQVRNFSRDSDGESYSITSLGAYRFDLPKDTLYIVQRVSADIENGQIAKITSYDEEEPVLEGVNDFYKYYWLFPFFIGVASFISLFLLSPESKKLLLSLLKMFVGGG